MGQEQANNSMINLANQIIKGDEQNLTEVISTSFQSVRSGQPKCVPTHQYPASVLPNNNCVSNEEV